MKIEGSRFMFLITQQLVFLSLSKACCLSFLAFVMFCCLPFPSISVWSQNDAIKSCHIYKKDKNGCFILDFFGSDLSKMDQTWSNWNSHQSKNVTIKSCYLYHENKHGQLFLTRSDDICPKWIKIDPTWSNLDFSPIRKCY